MTELQTNLGATLLARKGQAVPLGVPRTAPLRELGGEPDSEGISAVPGAAPEAVPDAGTTGTAPAASLLPFDFMAQRQSALDLTQLFPKASEAAFVPVPDAVTEAPVVVAATESPVPDEKPEPPRAAPALRIHTAAKLSRPPEPQRFPMRAAGVALVLTLGAAGYAYQNGWLGSETPADAQGSEAAAPAPQAANTVAAPTVASVVPPAAPPVSQAEAEPDQKYEEIAPTVDVVRIEADGAAVIAGRAAPGAELILLDNGTPIGTAQADAFGEWVFIPIDPLPSGAHDFGLVMKRIEGGISVPSLDKMPPNETLPEEDTAAPGVPNPNEPGTDRGAAATVPVPPRKPDTGTTPAAAAFAVQLASVKTRGGAEREWRTLQQRYPGMLSEMTLSLDEAKLAGGNIAVRLRIGAFDKRGEAAALCQRLAAKHQDCLVVRNAANQ